MSNELHTHGQGLVRKKRKSADDDLLTATLYHYVIVCHICNTRILHTENVIVVHVDTLLEIDTLLESNNDDVSNERPAHASCNRGKKEPSNA